MLRAQVHVSAAQQKKKKEDKTKGEGASLLTLKAIIKALKRKNNGRMIVHPRSLLLMLRIDP